MTPREAPPLAAASVHPMREPEVRTATSARDRKRFWLRSDVAHHDGDGADQGKVRDEQDESVYPGNEHQRHELERPHRTRLYHAHVGRLKGNSVNQQGTNGIDL